MKGLEPPRPETLDPKSNAATNYATCAVVAANLGMIAEICKYFGKILENFAYFCVWNGTTKTDIT